MKNSSHATVQASEAPTPAQFKDLYAQIESRRVTKNSMQKFLRSSSLDLTPENDAVVDLMPTHMQRWQKNFPGHEIALASRLIPFLDWKRPMRLRRPTPEKWGAFQRAIFWIDVQDVRFVDTKYLSCDTLPVPLKSEFAQTLYEDLVESYEDRPDLKHSFDSTERLLLELPVAAISDSMQFHWKVDKVSYEWLNGVVTGSKSTLQSLLYDNFINTLRVVAIQLRLNERIEDAYILLEMWGSGNYPIGLDQEKKLVVLCGS